MSVSNNLADLYTNPAVREFGATLRRSLRMNDDYASILDLEFAETPEAFAEALERFLRRFEGLARRKNLRRPTEKSLQDVVQLVDQYGVKLVRAALISHALVRGEREEEQVSTQPESQTSQELTESPPEGGNQP